MGRTTRRPAISAISEPGARGARAAREAVEQRRRARASCSDRRDRSRRRPPTAISCKKFFGELATEEAIGAQRVWVPGGLWDLRTAVKLATELGVTCAIDPLVREPGATDDPTTTSKRARSTSGSRALAAPGTDPERTPRGPRCSDRAATRTSPLTVAFASPERWQDARNSRVETVD